MTGHSPTRPDERTPSRRRVLLGVIGGVAGLGVTHSVIGSDAFTSAETTRDATIPIGDDPNSVLSVVIEDSVRRNQESQLVTITNQSETELEVDVELDSCDDGELILNGERGCQVTAVLADGDGMAVQVEADIQPNQALPFTIRAESTTTSFSASLQRETEVEPGPPGNGGPPCDDPPCNGGGGQSDDDGASDDGDGQPDDDGQSDDDDPPGEGGD